MDWMEYANDADVQAAFVTNGDTYNNTGGTITTDGNYKVHTFLVAQTGTAFTPLNSGNVAVLVVAGGGGGGGHYTDSGNDGGGGGGGGLVFEAAHAVTAQHYTITVGANREWRSSN